MSVHLRNIEPNVIYPHPNDIGYYSFQAPFIALISPFFRSYSIHTQTDNARNMKLQTAPIVIASLNFYYFLISPRHKNWLILWFERFQVVYIRWLSPAIRLQFHNMASKIERNANCVINFHCNRFFHRNNIGNYSMGAVCGRLFLPNNFRPKK